MVPDLTSRDEEEYITYLTALTKSATPAIAAQALTTLHKYGFNPTEPRAAGRWTTGGATTTTSETQQRRSRRRRVAAAQGRYDDAVQGNEVDNRLYSADRPGGLLRPAADINTATRKRYGIPTKGFSKLSPRRKAAAHALMSATVAAEHLHARRGRLAARVAAVKAELGRPNLTDHTRATLNRRLASATTALDNLDQRIGAADHDRAAAAKAWSRKSMVPDLVKGDVKPGQRYRHGWIPINPRMEELGIHNDRPHHESEHIIAADRIASHQGHPVDIKVSKWEDSPAEDDPGVSIDTHPPTVTRHYASLEDAPHLGEQAGQPFEMGYSGAMVDHEGAARAAAHLHDLVAIGRSGHKAAPATGKKTKHQRAAEKLDALIEQGDLNPSDKLMVGDDTELAITLKDLRELLAPYAPVSLDEKRLTRRVNHPKDEIYMDSGDLHMRLNTSGSQPVIQIASRERESTPWDPEGQDAWQTSHLTMDQAEELANKLDQYAKAISEG